MEFKFFMGSVIKSDSHGMAIISSNHSKPLSIKQFSSSNLNNPIESLDVVIDSMGEASAKAQGLKQIITQANKFFGTGQTLYFKIDGRVFVQKILEQCHALLKVGRKNLFHRDYDGSVRELQPLCLLDFYVHESVQRNGLGKLIFEHMLTNEGLDAHQLAYDRPSTKLLSFLRKHYNLSSYIPQNNNFVVYNQYWTLKNGPKQLQIKIEPKQEVKQQISQEFKSEPKIIITDKVPQKENPKLGDIKNLIQNTNQEIIQLQAQIKELSLGQQQPIKAMQTPWATNNSNMYQTTSKMMSTQIVQNKK